MLLSVRRFAHFNREIVVGPVKEMSAEQQAEVEKQEAQDAEDEQNEGG